MGKQLACQKYIFKIHSSRLRKGKWSINLPLHDARRNDEVITVADSQIMRWIDELNGVVDAEYEAKRIKAKIKHLRKTKNNVQSRRVIRQLYNDLDKLQFKPDYMCLIIDKPKDYYRACKGFSINGIKYKRLLGTSGGIKNSTIVFVSENVCDELKRRIDNDRDKSKELVTAKLEAYKSLTCSASIPVSFPNGVLVVNDAETTFTSDVVYLSDENDGEPTMSSLSDQEITLNASDGCGLMLPSLAKRWSDELKLEYTVSGVNTRFSFEKGMVFTFDFVDFAENVAGDYVVKDAWGNDVDVRNVELVLTTSMVKLWDSYESCDDYFSKSIANGYTFGVAKTCPETLESERNLNYQFIQSYDLSDDDLEELIRPTIDEIRDVIGCDWRKTVLFLSGCCITGDNLQSLENVFSRAIMADRRVLDDPFVRGFVYQQIRNRINRAKCGVIKVHGNYSVVSGDPYLLCQSMFGLRKTGLLRAGEIYNAYWNDIGADKLACFRAPMTCHNNIRLVRCSKSDDALYWYRHMKTVTIFNAWDTIAIALNGCDFDGDIVMLTDNRVLVDNLRPQPALMCVQRKAKKCIQTEEDFVRSNIESFGNEIGQITNRITSMFEVRAGFPVGSREYETLSYRIMCGQLFQQNAIDKAKGIVAKPMPRYWYDPHDIKVGFTGEELGFQRSIAASKKPYFMRYIYPALMRQYNTYIRNTDRNSQREFGMTVDELRAIPQEEMTDEQITFLHHYDRRMPVGVNDCVMNRICKRFESEFDGCVGRYKEASNFDHSILKTGMQYNKSKYYDIKRLYDSYNARRVNYATFTKFERTDEYDSFMNLIMLNEEFIERCVEACPDREELSNIVLDMCYSRSSTKHFAWSMCGDDIVNTLLQKNGGVMMYPTLDPRGDVVYGGKRFSVRTKHIEVAE